MNTQTQTAEVVRSSAELGPLPEPVATVGNDGHPRHIRHVWGIGETRLYGPPHGLYRADQMRAYATAAVAAERERCAKIVEPGALEPWEVRCGAEGIELMRDLAAAIRAGAIALRVHAGAGG